MPRRRVLLAFLLTALAVGVALVRFRVPPRPRCERCNVLLVTFDALRADHLGTYGYPRPTSPRIDALAHDAFVFRRNLSQSASTLASVPSMHTSKFTHLDRLLDDGVLRAGERTLAEVLAAAGWTTTAVISNQYAGCRWGLCQGFETTDEKFMPVETATHTAERALARLADSRPQPWFLWVHFLQPHAPYAPREDVFRTMYGAPTEEPTFFSPQILDLAFPMQLQRLTASFRRRGEPVIVAKFGGRKEYHLTPTVVRQLGALYDGNIAEGDRAFGLLLDRLERLGQKERTVVIVAADHGESLGEGGLIGHNRLWYRTLHTPLVVYVPGGGHERSDRLVMNVDILPTILDVVGLPGWKPIRGRSVFDEPPHEWQYAESSGAATLVQGDLRIEVSRRAAAAAAPARLFGVRADVLEPLNLAAARPADVERLRSVIEGVRATSLAPDPTAPDTDVEQKLRDLGYID